MKRIPLFLFGFFLFAHAYASPFENTQLHGRVVDGEKKPMQYVIVTLLKAEDSSLVKGAITDEGGNFSFDNLIPGNFLVAATFTGFAKSMQGPFAISGSQNLLIEDIVMNPSKDEKEVNIIAAQPLFTQKPDMLIMNVENSPVRINGTAWDLIGKSPGVFVDQNNNISLRGKSGVLIYVDGKNTYLNGDQLVSFLENISAADVVQIEIISNPSSKYDAQGSGGIINVVTKKGSQQGFNGNVRGGYGQAFYPKYDGGFNFNYAKEKFNVYGKYNGGDVTKLERIYINRNVPYNDVVTNFNQHSSAINNSIGHSGALGIDFYAKHNITWGAKLNGSLETEHNHAENNTLISTNTSDTTSLLNQFNTDKNLFQNISANIYYQQKLDTLGGELSGSADYLNYHIDNLSNFDLNYFDNFGTISAPSQFQKSESVSDILIYAGQLDYSHPFGKKYKLEAGVKSSYVQTTNNLEFDTLSNNEWKNDSTRSNKFIYKEQINAAYANGYGTFGKWQLETGLRAEQTLSDGNSPTTGQHLKKNYVQLFPSVFALYKLNDKNSLNATYARRVNRPDYQDLNPFVSYLDKYTYEKGNPYLQPEIANSVDLTYSYLDAFFVTAGVSKTSHGMTDVTQQVDSTGVGYKTTVNLNTVINDYFGFSVPIPIGNWFLMENEFNLMYNRFKSDLFNTPIDNKSLNYTASSTFTFSLAKTLKIQMWGWYNSPGTYGIWKMKSKGGVGLGISESFFNKQLSVSLNAQDIFRTSGMRATINFQNQDVYMQFTPEAPRINLRLRYTFGNNKATRKAQDKSSADELQKRTGK